jgi:hypothetical protein
MHEAILWARFLGAWLLVAGPLYQGSIELTELDIDREGVEGIRHSAAAAATEAPSAWWWLLPPVMYVLRRRWSKAFRRAVFAQFSELQREQFRAFRNKANGWFAVAAGATLLATGETWEITEHHKWPAWLFWLLAVAMLALSILNTAARMISDQRGRRAQEAASAAPAPRDVP